MAAPQYYLLATGELSSSGRTLVGSGNMERTLPPDMADFQALCRLPLGAAHLLAGRLEDAQAIADGVLVLAREHQERGNEAYASRLLGEIAAHRDPPESMLAEAHYQQ